MLKNVRPSVIAQPLAARKWQVIAGAWDLSQGGRLVGFIEELGGTYEVEILDRPALSQFFETFKEAIDFFERVELDSDGHGTFQASAAC